MTTTTVLDFSSVSEASQQYAYDQGYDRGYTDASDYNEYKGDQVFNPYNAVLDKLMADGYYFGYSAAENQGNGAKAY